MSKSIDFELQSRFIYEYLNGLNCPRALTVWLLYTHKENDQLVELEFQPGDYNDLCKARDSLAATKLLSKAKFLKVSHDPKERAIKKFRAAEDDCRKSNSRIRTGSFAFSRTADAIFIAQQKISSILGCFDSRFFDEFVDSCDWGPGATTALPRRNSSKPNKYQFEIGITREAYGFVKPWFSLAYPLWGDKDFDLSKGYAKIVTVPKNAKSDRVIAIEPGINLWFQKGIGSMIRRRLSRTGVDLNHQDHNQALSRLASKGNLLATIDFSSASDTISLAVVEELFSSDMLRPWLALMRAFRSSSAFLDGEYLSFNKFSSMGNGFTFELESLIFYAVGYASCVISGCSSSNLSIYGDDLILPSGAVDVARLIFEDLGFKINTSKSYSSGYYRESCGAHWWNGVNIKPIFLKEPINGRTEVLKVANSVRRLAHRRNYHGCDRVLRRSWLLLASSLGHSCPRVSEGYGDVGLVVNFSELLPDQRPKRLKHGLEGFNVRVLVSTPITSYFDGIGLLLDRVKAIGKQSLQDCLAREDYSFDVSLPTSNDMPLPMRTRNVCKFIPVSRWYDFGDWY